VLRVNELLVAEKPIQTAGEICSYFLGQKLGLADIYRMLPSVKKHQAEQKMQNNANFCSL